jgi:dipeptidyl aminopeptidase/acylaminoacyl peptidase
MTLRGSWIVVFLWALTSACGGDPHEPVMGALELTMRTTGHDFDPDGYSVTVDGGSPLAVPTNGSASIPDLAAGVHTVTLAGLAGNCALTTPAPLEVTVPGAGGAVATVEITCTAVYTLAYRGELGVELTDAAGTVHRTLLPNGNISWQDTGPLAWSPDGRLLAVSKNDIVRRVWLANLDDGSTNQFLSVGDLLSWHLAGAWSPDGRELLLDISSGGNTSHSSLIRYPLDESYPPQGIYGISQGMTGGVFCPALAKGVLWPDWSPDASQIVICEQSQLYILSRDGTSKRLLTDGTQPDWSPDGGDIAYVVAVAGHAPLRLIHPDGSGDRPLTAPPTNETDTGPTWSPDGSKVAFVRLGYGPDNSVTSVHAYVVDRDGTNERQLAVLPVGGFIPTWSADGLHLAYSGSGTYVVNVDGSGFRLVSAQPTEVAQWRP